LAFHVISPIVAGVCASFLIPNIYQDEPLTISGTVEMEPMTERTENQEEELEGDDDDFK
jgi:hypothetical protein